MSCVRWTAGYAEAKSDALISVPNPTIGHVLWVVSKRIRSRTHEAQMSFRWKVAGLSLGTFFAGFPVGPKGKRAQADGDLAGGFTYLREGCLEYPA